MKHPHETLLKDVKQPIFLSLQSALIIQGYDIGVATSPVRHLKTCNEKEVNPAAPKRLARLWKKGNYGCGRGIFTAVEEEKFGGE